MVANNSIMGMGKKIWEAQNHDKEPLEKISKFLDIKSRKAYYLALLWERFGSRTGQFDKLEKIGWSKLAIIAEHARPGDEERYLDFAETTTTKELAEMFKLGGTLVLAGQEKKRTVLMRFTVAEYAVLEKALKAYGASSAKKGKGLVNMEQATLKIIHELSRSKEHF